MEHTIKLCVVFVDFHVAKVKYYPAKKYLGQDFHNMFIHKLLCVLKRTNLAVMLKYEVYKYLGALQTPHCVHHKCVGRQ
jgi:hypothetical protein